MTSFPVGWGGGLYGPSPWGGGPISQSLTLNMALAVRENVVRLTFSIAPNFTEILDPYDASNPKRYSITPIAGTFGLDGLPARPVFPIVVNQAPVALSAGSQLDVIVDRPFSPYPARYIVACNNLWTATKMPLVQAFSSAQFYGVKREFVPALPEQTLRSRDIAAPYAASALGSIGNASLLVAGAYSPDDTGDLAIDDGLVSLRKWVLRVCLTAVGGFSYMPSFGAGLIAEVKKLNMAATRQRIANNCQVQIAQHPLIVKAVVVFQTVQPGLVKMQVLAKTVSGIGIKVEQNFNVAF